MAAVPWAQSTADSEPQHKVGWSPLSIFPRKARTAERTPTSTEAPSEAGARTQAKRASKTESDRTATAVTKRRVQAESVSEAQDQRFTGRAGALKATRRVERQGEEEQKAATSSAGQERPQASSQRDNAGMSDAAVSTRRHGGTSVTGLPTAFRLASGEPVLDYPMPEGNSCEREAGTAVDTIVLHFSGELPERPDDPYDPARIVNIYRKDGVSAHYLIDRQGTIYRLVDESRRAYHAGKGSLPWQPGRTDKLNNYSIGIELLGMGSRKDMSIFMPGSLYDDMVTSHPEFRGFTDAQYRSLAGLVPDIRARHPRILPDRRHIVGHSDYAPKRRTDPGELFEWQRLGLPAEKQ